MRAPNAVSAPPSPIHIIHLIDDPGPGLSVSVETAARAIGVSRSAAYRAIRAARDGDPSAWPTPIIMIGSRVRIPRLALAQILLLDPMTGDRSDVVSMPGSAGTPAAGAGSFITQITPPEVVGLTDGRPD